MLKQIISTCLQTPNTAAQESRSVDISSPASRIYRRCLHVLMALYAKSPLRMVRYARRHCPVYRRLYRELRPIGWFRSVVRFPDIPLLTKDTIHRADPADFLAKSPHRVRRYAETTGSSGKPSPSFYTQWEFRRIQMLFDLVPEWRQIRRLAHMHSANRHRVPPFAVNGITHGFTVAGHVFGQALDQTGLITAHLGSRTTIAPPERIAETIARLKPVVIAATPTDFLSWMKILQTSDPVQYREVTDHLQYLISSAELCAPSRSSQIERAFNIRHLNFYGSVEGFFTVPCRCGQCHIPSIFHTEVASEDLKATRRFGTGRFLFTNLARYSSPYIRYLLDDYVTISKSHCPEGFKTSILPHGRYELTIPLDRKRIGIGHIEQILFEHAFFADYEATFTKTDGRFTSLQLRAELYDYDRFEKGGLLPGLAKAVSESFRRRFDIHTRFIALPMGSVYDYRRIRTSKPIWRLRVAQNGDSGALPAEIHYR